MRDISRKATLNNRSDRRANSALHLCDTRRRTMNDAHDASLPHERNQTKRTLRMYSEYPGKSLCRIFSSEAVRANSRCRVQPRSARSATQRPSPSRSISTVNHDAGNVPSDQLPNKPQATIDKAFSPAPNLSTRRGMTSTSRTVVHFQTSDRLS